MHGANSVVTYQPSTVTKTIISDELEESLNVAAVREVHMMVRARTEYPYIPNFYSLSGTVIVMERVYGIILIDYMAANPTIDTYSFIVNKVRDAMILIIKAGVYNKDITPNNILISKNNELWIVDFGIAELLYPTDDLDEILDENLSLFLRSFNYQLKEINLGHIAVHPSKLW
jgi:RIO-like serine/threonine protein kinase